MATTLYDGAARRSALDRADRLRHLSDTEKDLVRLAGEPGFPRWLEQTRATGGCARPVYLSGRITVTDRATGVVVRHYDTVGEPAGRLPVRCRNRRALVCPPCSREHSGDTFHLVRAGLVGGKGTPARVVEHPRLFVTLTAPSFGAVHRAGPDRCRPRRGGGECEHGRPVGCGLVHGEADAAIGRPLCPDCYDYASHVLWHAHAGELWNRTCRAVRRCLATAAGITQTDLARHLRVSFAKVAEYQRRGAVHFHAVIRLDGPDGPDTPPPSWANAALLADVIRTAAAAVRVHMPYTAAVGEYVFRWGEQIDMHPIRAFGDGSAVTDEAVAAYVAKYVGKSLGDSGGLDHRVHDADSIALAPVSAHLRALMGACWRLGGLPELAHLRLRGWAHTLGYRGHCLTKSRLYSTTYTALRAARASFRTGCREDGRPADTVTESAWWYVGSGHTPGAAEIAAGIAEDLAILREARRLSTGTPERPDG
ncbi:replication initiator [Actinacidiphila alni]|uniref:replication initiator n=1 Tax=Actinacidiphila alni TaxID=380248 RepID=UPI0033F12336